MKEKPWLLKHLIPLTVYVFVILTIFVAKFFVPWAYVLSIAAVLMLLIPIVLKSEAGDLRWDFKGVLLGLGVSAVLLSIYIAVIALYGHYIGKSLVKHDLSYSFALMQLLLVAYLRKYSSEAIFRVKLVTI